MRYLRTLRLLQQFTHAHAAGSYSKLLDSLARTQVLTLEGWLRDPLTATQTRDLLEVLDDRFRQRATLVASQVPVAHWHERFPDPTLADSLLDRFIHNAYQLELQGESQRNLRPPLSRPNK